MKSLKLLRNESVKSELVQTEESIDGQLPVYTGNPSVPNRPARRQLIKYTLCRRACRTTCHLNLECIMAGREIGNEGRYDYFGIRSQAACPLVIFISNAFWQAGDLGARRKFCNLYSTHPLSPPPRRGKWFQVLQSVFDPPP